MMPIQITSKKDGFRRCGIAHSASMIVYPDNRFTPEEIICLKAEPRLIIVVINKEKIIEKNPKINKTLKVGNKKGGKQKWQH